MADCTIVGLESLDGRPLPRYRKVLNSFWRCFLAESWEVD